MKRAAAAILAALFAAAGARAGEIKDIGAMKIIAVEWRPGDSVSIAGPFAELVNYYNNGDLDDIAAMQIVFPQMSFDFADGASWIAVQFTGAAKETARVKIKETPAGKFYAETHNGPYQKLGEAVRRAYRLLAAEGYAPDKTRPRRLLYWNSPDDNPPEKLRTEIQIPVVRK
ncbi:MAG: GyrI-like domain-containing protein [Gammaproteobacteria bacterium]